MVWADCGDQIENRMQEVYGVETFCTTLLLKGRFCWAASTKEEVFGVS